MLKIIKKNLALPAQYWPVALIIFIVISIPCWGQSNSKNLQLQLGESVSIYSEKAYRKNKGLSFEAVGNVVILSGQDTLYGEKASLDVKTGQVKIEGNVRYISQNLTIYGSQIEFNSPSGQLEVDNARIITTDFNIVATKIKKIAKNEYYARQAEFTTCKDCTESWTIYGNEINIEMNQYVTIKHALTKIKGVSVLYFPYIVIPIKNERESGLLFPLISSRLNEGIRYQQPIYWAIDDYKDITLTPSFYGRRGYGSDIQYREVFGEKRWLNLNTRFLNDSIYLPGKTNFNDSETNYFRSFYDLESHYQFDNDLSSHFLITTMKDMDMMSDFNRYTDEYVQASDVGFEGFIENRFEHFSLGLESQFRRNLLVEDPEAFDQSYVQVLPSVYFNAKPYTLIQTDKLFLQHLSVGMDSDFTVFKQQSVEEDDYIRNAQRLNFRPYLDWHLFTLGPVKAKTKYALDYQHYRFTENDEDDFRKYAGVMTTELSFSMDKIFGLAYEETIPVSEIKPEYLEQLGKETKSKKDKRFKDLVGDIPSFENSLTKESIRFVKNSYRHSQEFKFLHHYIAGSDERGSDRFNQQINSNKGWFDYDDGIRADIFNLGSFQTRTSLPLSNTIEFQWNNSLIKKSPKTFNVFDDEKYLRDNFNYRKIGYFNLSQGVVVDSDNVDSFEDRLTRLYLNTGYSASKWSVNLSEYYFHQTTDHITSLGVQKRYDTLSLLGNYTSNSLQGANLKTLRGGFQMRPVDVLGFSALKEFDLDADQSIRSIYQVDFMPNNNCWILNLNYRETVVDTQYSFNWVFNFGNDDFKEYRSNFFRFDRIGL